MFNRLEDAREAQQVVFIGYDPMEDAAAKMLAHSIRSRTEMKTEMHFPHISAETFEITGKGISYRDLVIIPIIRDELLAYDLCTRPIDPRGSTQFSITRFMVPELMNFSGVGIFFDCDMIITRDIKEMFDLFDPSKALQCVKHDYQPKADPKMGGMPQTTYPRKNWSSTVIYNCDHPENHNLTKELVETAEPKFLHRFMWVKDELIGELPTEFNFLAGEYDKPDTLPFNVHHTLGPPGVWHEQYLTDVDYKDLWMDEFEATFGRPHDPDRDIIR